MRGKIKLKKVGGRKQKIKVRYLFPALVIGLSCLIPKTFANASGCPDVKIIFARGSGSPMTGDANYDEFVRSIKTKLDTTSLTYEFTNLDYPAVGVDEIGTLIQTFFSAGEAYKFGDSVNNGVAKLTAMVNSSACPNTKFILGGYSQGAMVVSKALSGLNADKVIYAATFGDPKLYLPEGAGLIPPACRGQNLSDYRMYVPDCQAYKGLLGGYVPYEPENWLGKLGTWCNGGDIFCSSHFNISNHLAYASDGLYEDASRLIFDKIAKYFGIENHVSSPHDTAILIDSTGSMAGVIDGYKNEALRLARETLSMGGRVALYDYRDLDDPYDVAEHCDFETCTLENFEQALNSIETDGGGDEPESLLSASFHVMKRLKWQHGATKSLIILTDANFLAPDRDGMTFDEVVALSKRIDPVNFYIITTPENEDDYLPLANATDGKVVTNFDELSLLTDYIISRYDSLPRVEEGEAEEKPTISITDTERIDETTVKIIFETDGDYTMVIVNDMILGITNEKEIVLNGYNGGEIRLVPVKNDFRGDAATINLGGATVPLAPNTGQK